MMHTVDESMREEGLAREFVNKAQRLRKAAGINPGDPVDVFVEVLEDKDNLNHVLLLSLLFASLPSS